MAHVKVVWSQGSYASYDELFLEGDYKRVSFDGMELVVGNKRIRDLVWFQEKAEEENNPYILNDASEILYLEIDGKVFRDVKEE